MWSAFKNLLKTNTKMYLQSASENFSSAESDVSNARERANQLQPQTQLQLQMRSTAAASSTSSSSSTSEDQEWLKKVNPAGDTRKSMARVRNNQTAISEQLTGMVLGSTSGVDGQNLPARMKQGIDRETSTSSTSSLNQDKHSENNPASQGTSSQTRQYFTINQMALFIKALRMTEEASEYSSIQDNMVNTVKTKQLEKSFKALVGKEKFKNSGFDQLSTQIQTYKNQHPLCYHIAQLVSHRWAVIAGVGLTIAGLAFVAARNCFGNGMGALFGILLGGMMAALTTWVTRLSGQEINELRVNGQGQFEVNPALSSDKNHHSDLIDSDIVRQAAETTFKR